MSLENQYRKSKVGKEFGIAKVTFSPNGEKVMFQTGGDRRSNNYKNQGLVNLPKVETPINTFEKLASIAGVSDKTYRMGVKVLSRN